MKTPQFLDEYTRLVNNYGIDIILNHFGSFEDYCQDRQADSFEDLCICLDITYGPEPYPAAIPNQFIY